MFGHYFCILNSDWPRTWALFVVFVKMRGENSPPLKGEDLRINRSVIQRARLLKVQYDKEMADPVYVSHAKFEDIFPSRKPDPSSSQNNPVDETIQPKQSEYDSPSKSNHRMTRKEADVQKRKERAAQRREAAATTPGASLASDFPPPVHVSTDQINITPPSSDNVQSNSYESTPPSKVVSKRQAAEARRRERSSGKKERVFHAISKRGMMYDEVTLEPNKSNNTDNSSGNIYDQSPGLDDNTSNTDYLGDNSSTVNNLTPNDSPEKRPDSGYDRKGNWEGEQQEFFIPEPFVFDASHDELAARLLELRNRRLAKEKKMFEDWAKTQEK